MSAVLRVYDPGECDADGKPLDWERCRACEGKGHTEGGESWVAPGHTRTFVCSTCDGHGSLKAAALASQAYHDGHRCEDCGHPMSEGTWEGETPDVARDPNLRHDDLAHAERCLLQGVEPTGTPTRLDFFSPCDEGCRHGGPGRWKEGTHPNHTWKPATRLGQTADGTLMLVLNEAPVEASWRPVDVRLLSWPHDLRPEHLAVLCFRCWAAR